MVSGSRSATQTTGEDRLTLDDTHASFQMRKHRRSGREAAGGAWTDGSGSSEQTTACRLAGEGGPCVRRRNYCLALGWLDRPDIVDVEPGICRHDRGPDLAGATTLQGLAVIRLGDSRWVNRPERLGSPEC